MRRLVWFTIGFAASCTLAGYFWMGETVFLPGVCAAVLAAVLWRFCPEKKMVPYAALILLGVGLGFIWSGCYDLLYAGPTRSADGTTVAAEIDITACSWETEYGGAADGKIKIGNRSYKIRVYLNDYVELTPGDSIVLPLRLRVTADGGVNEPTYHRSNGILLLGYQQSGTQLSVRQGEPGMFAGFVWRLRERMEALLDECFSGDAAAFAKALLLGKQDELSYRVKTDLKVSGIRHVVAVSGLHVSILFALVYLFTSRHRYLTAFIGIPLILLFMALTGFTASVVRAGIMQIMIMLALAVNREYDPPSALAFTVLVMLIVNPLASTGVGFQLSAGSLIGIFRLDRPIRGWLLERVGKGKGRAGRMANHLCSGISLSAAAQVVTAPLTAAYFGTVSLVGILTNVAVVWVISFIFYGLMLSCLLGSVWLAAGRAAARLVSLLIRYVLGAASVVSRIPLSAVYTCSIYTVIWLVFCYCLILGLLTGQLKRPGLTMCCCAITLCAAVGAAWLEPMLCDQCVTVLDVGQGQSIILQSGGKTFVVDCGGDDAEDTADITSQKLLSMGLTRIDGLILTHYDRDHAGAAPYLLERIQADALYLPLTVDSEQILPKILDAAADARIIWVEKDLILESGQIKITLFAPESAAAGNESCIAVLFQTEKCDTLITGDMSQFRERQILSRAQLPELEVLIVGHHGSNTSTSTELLAVTSPETAIISVGGDNPYGHPTQEVLQRLLEAGCRIYRTDFSGDIMYRR